MKQQRGFTLIELMLSLALGLVIVAAATMLFLTGMRSNAMQRGVSDLQDNANFGLNYITQDIRLANLNNPTAAINDRLSLGGVVLTTDNLATSVNDLDAEFLSISGEGVSNVRHASDQLVIQYEPVIANGYDCQGRLIPDTNRVIIQRYFLRADTNSGTNEGNPLALACAAGHYNEDGWIGDSDASFTSNGEIIMKRVDHFRVLLSTVNTSNIYQYFDVESYLDEPVKPRIVGVNLGLLTRSAENVGTDVSMRQENAFTVLDQDTTVNVGGNPNGYLRRVLTQEVAFRNGLGDRR